MATPWSLLFHSLLSVDQYGSLHGHMILFWESPRCLSVRRLLGAHKVERLEGEASVPN